MSNPALTCARCGQPFPNDAPVPGHIRTAIPDRTQPSRTRLDWHDLCQPCTATLIDWIFGTEPDGHQPHA